MFLNVYCRVNNLVPILFLLPILFLDGVKSVFCGVKSVFCVVPFAHEWVDCLPLTADLLAVPA